MNALFPKIPLGEIFNLEYGASLPERDRSGVGYPVFGSNGIVGRHAKCLVHGPGIVVGRKGSVGEVCWSEESFWPIDTAYYVLAKEEINLRWLFWLLTSTDLKKLDAATGVPGLNRNDVYGLMAHSPRPEEQSRIATVLDTVDEAIAKTEVVIAKLKEIRAGLLHDLLTRGLDENGQLRDPVAHPEQFQDSPLGRIPKEWKVGPFRDFGTSDRPYLRTGPFGSSLKQEHWVAEGVPVVTIGSLGEGEFISSEILHVSKETARLLVAYSLLPGDIVFSRVADVGRSVVVTEAERGWIMSSNMMWISVDQRKADPQYVQLNISSNAIVRRQIQGLVNSAGREVANAAVMNSLRLPWAPLNEQKRILLVLHATDSHLHGEQVTVKKLYLLKSGLMADLLTGRVRVPDGIAVTE